MAKMTLAQLKAAYSTPTKEGGERSNLVNNYYPFWNMKSGQRAIIRYVPDRDSSNPRGFLVEKVFHNLTINGQKKTVPCLSMYGEDCPICKISQEYYKAKDEVNGKKYWRKKQYIAQALVVEDPLPADETTGETHQGKVRYFALGFQIYNIIKEAFAAEDDPLEGIPYDFEDGYDFIIKKSEKGGYADYSVGTKFVSKQRAMDEDELAIVEEGMIELHTLLPKNPGFDKVQAMLNADLNGEDYQEEGRGSKRKTNDEDEEEFVPKKPAAKKQVSDDEDPPFEVSKPAAKAAPKAAVAESAGEADGDVDEMLAAIRARRQAK